VVQDPLADIVTLEDANHAGIKGKVCTLILTEGESGKSFVEVGLNVVGHDTYGVLALQGKLVNISKAEKKKIKRNVVVKNIMTCMGLEWGIRYQNSKSLRYQQILIMVDQDHDGSHIKGLIINLFSKLWPELLKCEGFLQVIIPFICLQNDMTHNWCMSSACMHRYAIPRFPMLPMGSRPGIFIQCPNTKTG
jgi:DNA topoisomerase-2